MSIIILIFRNTPWPHPSVIADKFNRVFLLFISTLLFSGALAGTALSTKFWHLVVFRILLGVGWGFKWFHFPVSKFPKVWHPWPQGEWVQPISGRDDLRHIPSAQTRQGHELLQLRNVFGLRTLLRGWNLCHCRRPFWNGRRIAKCRVYFP